MSTWSEIRKQAFRLLDRDEDESGTDIANAIDRKLTELHLWLVRKRPPEELCASASVTFADTDTHINIVDATAPSFNLVGDEEFFALQVEERTWEFVNYRQWIRQVGALGGNRRKLHTWTIGEGGDKIFLVSAPSNSETWTVKLIYYNAPDAIEDEESPQIPEEYEPILVYGVVKEFPHFFQTQERTALFASVVSMYKEYMDSFMRALKVDVARMKLHPRTHHRIRSAGSRYSIIAK